MFIVNDVHAAVADADMSGCTTSKFDKTTSCGA